MSEYQYIYFEAVDKPLNDKQLDYMHRQSTRAEITEWQFQNEYHFGDFRGNSSEMMRRGYDVHLHYANFGVRKIQLSLPSGIPISTKLLKTYSMDESVEWTKDKNGKGGVLSIDPDCDAGSYYEGYYEIDQLTSSISKIRDGLIAGDTRLFYLTWLAFSWDEDALEPQVPAGLSKLPPELIELANFYELDCDVITAASDQSPSLPERAGGKISLDTWLESQSPENLRSLLRRVLAGDAAAVRAESLVAVRDQSETAMWPTNEGSRTLGELRQQATSKAEQRRKREQASEKRKRDRHLAKIRKDPSAAISDAEKLIQTRSTVNYSEAASLLADLRDAIGGEEGARMAEQAANILVKQYPTRHHLKRTFKVKGLNYR
ncbi:MAG: hypothetical protein AAF664_24570 [Planctomycetota bacterium]